MFRNSFSRSELSPQLFSAMLLSFGLSVAYLTSAPPAVADEQLLGESLDAHEKNLVNLIASPESQSLRETLLKHGCANGIDCALNRWYSGYVQIDGQWMNRARARVSSSMHEGYSQYYSRRDQSADTLADHEQLARLCDSLGLRELERMHWLHVLRFDRNDAAALNCLGLTWHDGVLLTIKEKEQSIKKEKAEAKARKAWQKKARRLRRALENGEPEQRLAAKQEMQAIADPTAVPALLEEFSQVDADPVREENLRLNLIATLGRITSPDAIMALVRAATYANSTTIQYAAIEELRNKHYEEYLPLLLSELEMPIESSVSVQQQGNQVVTSYTYSQENAYGETEEKIYRDYRTIVGPRYLTSDIYKKKSYPRKLDRPGYFTKARTIPAFMCGGHLVPEQHIASKWIPPKYSQRPTEYHYQYTNYAEHPTYQYRRQQTLLTSHNRASQDFDAVENRNLDIQHNNERVAEVLKEVTNELFEPMPKSWWKWWQEYLEKHPDIAALGIGQNFNLRYNKQEPRGLPRGTWVWTRDGKKQVESILSGDFVLSQDVETGELAYKVVLGIQNPQKLDVSKISLGDTEIHMTPGHIIWTAGLGWKKVSTLEPGFLLHGIDQLGKVETINEAYAIDSYDLIVDDFHTLFVGNQGVLVHDGSQLRKTHNALPGFTVLEIAQAAKVAAGTEE